MDALSLERFEAQLAEMVERSPEDSVVAVTAPLLLPDDGLVLIGLYGPGGGSRRSCIRREHLAVAAVCLFSGNEFSVAVHGLKRIREVYGLGELNLNPDRVLDTRLMAHLVDPGQDELHRYRLKHLVHEYLAEPYPVRQHEFFALDRPDFLAGCLERDAQMIYRLAEALRDRTDDDLLAL
jgi:hypothetical protein